MSAKEEFEKLNERKKYYYIIVDDDTIHSLIRYYKLDHENEDHGKEVTRFAKEAAIKGDTLE
jgi:hypothetical protein